MQRGLYSFVPIDTRSEIECRWIRALEIALLVVGAVTILGTAPPLALLWLEEAVFPTDFDRAAFKLYALHPLWVGTGLAGGGMSAAFLLLKNAFRWPALRLPAFWVTWLAAGCWLMLLLTLYFPRLLIICVVE